MKKKVVKMSLEAALKKAGPEMERSVKVALKRAFAFGAVLGLLTGILLAAWVISWNTAPKLVRNAQPCDLFAFGTVRPELSESAPQLCWTDVNVPDVNDMVSTVFVCPTTYSMQVQLIAGDINDDVVKDMYEGCVQVREFLANRYADSHSGDGVQEDSNVSVTGGAGSESAPDANLASGATTSVASTSNVLSGGNTVEEEVRS